MADQKRDIDLVLITGGGASREFGDPTKEGHQLFPGWCHDRR